MILFDLDGTLLTSNDVISPVTVNAIEACKQKGYHIGFITARSRSKKNICLLDKLPYDFVAFYNGAVIYAKNRLIESNILTYEQATLMLRRLNDDFPEILMDVHLEPWNFTSICNVICHMESGNRITCSLNNLPKCDVQRIRLESKSLLFIPLQFIL